MNWQVPFTCLLLGSAISVGAAENDAAASSAAKISYELDADYSYVGDAGMKLGGGRTGDVSEQSNLARIVVTPQWGAGPLFRFGVEWQRFSFGLPADAGPLPNTLQSVSAVVGVDLQFFDAWLVRLEAQPGFYGDADLFRGRNLNVPFLLGGSYIASADLQWIAGLSVDIDREYPVIPAVGMRWKFADRWTLNAILPTPRLQYELRKGATIFAGGEIKSGTYRVGDETGRGFRAAQVSHGVVEYDEMRVGAGGEWKVSGSWTVTLEGGYMAYRDFNFHRADTRLETDSGAPYGQLAISARF